MGKFILFVILWQLLGNPLLAILVLLLVLYLVDRRFIGLTPSIIRPFRRGAAIRRLRQQVLMNPNDIPAKHELARLLIERKKYAAAKELLMPLQDALDHSAEYWDDLGTSLAALGEQASAEAAIRNALSINPRVKYGTPYLRLAALHAKTNPQAAIAALDEFKTIHTSSCEAYYRLAQIYAELGRKEEAAQSLAACSNIYKALPKYKKRQERKWALLAWMRRMKG
ncbi:tetratricopeptide (TPR) repeat protein [Paenibacillus phyllosphaerae]|uniref:Tetratricopeptide (TPR) repeat protein n=1 Tax=Paenibacillus phyllosphaerae TaxID=274593 RepID=A0A7W5B3E3_9BACL|nr:tetratricopeptide repeat protein [Paenibacillus phyllosphaerae]MBB3113603.1 tetratricopeptide (TPR) repeat protein [Paenibacillus phyllosphaerae]